MKQEDWTEDLRERLAEHEEPVPADLWADIESRLEASKPSVVPWRRWAAAAAIVLLLSGGVLLLWNRQEQSLPADTKSLLANEETLPSKEEIDTTTTLTTGEYPVTSIPIPPRGEVDGRGCNQTTHVKSEETPLLVPHLEGRDMAATDSVPEGRGTTVHETLPDNFPATPLDRVEPTLVVSARHNKERMQVAHVPSKTRKGALPSRLTAALYAGNGLSEQRTSSPVLMSETMMQHFNTQQEGAGARLSAPVRLNDYEEQTHHLLPVSVGLALSVPVSRRLSAGTGIVYSRLQSDFTSVMKGMQITRQQTLHYLGVPLNLQYSLLPVGRLNVYASAGIQADFNVLSRLKTNNTETDGEKDRCQWSLNGSVGLSYSLTPQLALYAEPGIRYMVDNHSSVQNYFKDRPTSLNLQLGLRLSIGK